MAAKAGYPSNIFHLPSLLSLYRILRHLQLCYILLELAPKYLLEMFKHYVVLCEDFKGVG